MTAKEIPSLRDNPILGSAQGYGKALHYEPRRAYSFRNLNLEYEIPMVTWRCRRLEHVIDVLNESGSVRDLTHALEAAPAAAGARRVA